MVGAEVVVGLVVDVEAWATGAVVVVEEELDVEGPVARQADEAMARKTKRRRMESEPMTDPWQTRRRLLLTHVSIEASSPNRDASSL